MQYLNKLHPFPGLALALLLAITGIGSVQAFSFNFGDDYYHPYWGAPFYRPLNPYFYMPQLPSYDRSTMVRNRQDLMDRNTDAMQALQELLYGRYGFDRAEAVKLARKIELSSGYAMSRHFHPGAVRDMSSHVRPTYWGNEQTFQANAQALQAAAKDLADELSKTPTEAEGTVMLRKRWSGGDEEREAVSAKVWDKYNNLSNTCVSCHHSFRGPSW